MARGNREQRRRQHEHSPAVVVTDEDGVPSLARHIAQEDALQEEVVSVSFPHLEPDPNGTTEGWDRIEGGEEVEATDRNTVDEDAEFLREVATALETDGIDPEEYPGEVTDPHETSGPNSHVLDHTAGMSDSALEALSGLATREPTEPSVPHPTTALRSVPLDIGAPMSPEAVEAVRSLLVRGTPPRPGVRPRMSADRLEMRIRIPDRWKRQHPKRPGTIAHENWLLYVDGMTVSAYLESHDRRRARSDLQWDLDHDFVRLQTPQEYAAETQEAADMALEERLAAEG